MAKMELMVKMVQREKNGDPGKDGINGQDGYTPKKGTDYFTQNEIEEIENDILEKVDVPQQVFYWDGETNSDGLSLWTEALKANKKSDVLVFVKGGYEFAFSKNGINGNTSYYSADTLERGGQGNSYHKFPTAKKYLRLTTSNDEVTNITFTGISGREIEVLLTNEDYSVPYTPLYDGSPATKKYVDDSITNAITNAIGGSY